MIFFGAYSMEATVRGWISASKNMLHAVKDAHVIVKN